MIRVAASSGQSVQGMVAQDAQADRAAAPSEIAALRADGDFTHVFVADQPTLMILRTLGHFESLLPSPPFRGGQSLIISRDRLRRIEPSRPRAHHLRACRPRSSSAAPLQRS
jgi:DNA-binding LytR/AlgR family response regulator